jgi:hypothetical protein
MMHDAGNEDENQMLIFTMEYLRFLADSLAYCSYGTFKTLPNQLFSYA